MAVSIAAPSCAAPASRPAGSPRSARCRSASVRKAEAGPPPAAGRAGHHPQEHLHALLGRLHGHRRGAERRVDRPGAGLGQPDQSRLALRQGRGGARARARRPPPEISDEARQRPVDPASPGTRRSTRSATSCMEIRAEVGPGIGLLAGLGQVLQRGRLPQSASSRRSGAPTTSDHQARICHSTTVAGVANTWGYGAMTNSYNDIRNSKTHGHHGRQSGRGASGVAAASARGQGAQPGELHRHRSAPHAHRRARDRICAHPSGHRHPGDLGHALAHLRERLGGQGVHPAARLRHGRRPQGGREVDARGGRARHRRAGRAAQARRRDVRQAEARDADLVHGRDPAHGRHRQRARVLHPAAGDRQRRRLRQRRQHLPRPLQRAGRDRSRPRYRDAAALLRPRRRRLEALVPRLGGRLRLDAVALRFASR